MKPTEQDSYNPFKDGESIRRIIDLFDSIHHADDLKEALKTIARDVGYDCLAFVDYSPLPNHIQPVQVYGHYQEELAVLFESDKVLAHSKSGIRLCSLAKLTGALNIAESLHVLPLRGIKGIIGALVFNVPCELAYKVTVEQVDWYWTILSPSLLNAALRCRKDHFNITKRERDCVLWASEGKTSWEISQILGITERTVNFHLTNCIEKTQSANRQQAIVKCLINNLI
ncbi:MULTISPECIES: helix-turn-helix transcriptional regulator [Pseudoalteromonas]|uniref:Helix-turn-helix transcriptional regulator n=1 Tax=Pseudoalteromonas obscura TaxID=3048491 RepID=A0ABT7ERV3_9GAMM|nr:MULTISPECIES: helix-turn-helix transcriptional regulator [Pseudoalteromonas]MBQ4839864.1 helix-turn-helix transcriptional regulator [Pseudoalteromonas luteoviolacea]MDK2597790.1 helix-turn-helix transcriptional regulator [Pseudoalteromonas sp. P94(2023)]